MPIYLFESEDGEQIEKICPINDIPEEVEENGKVYKYKPTFGTNFLLKGSGWVGRNLSGSIRRTKVNDLRVDYDMKNAMKEAGEKV